MVKIPKCRLTNPAKSEIGKVTKDIKMSTHVNQWRNTKDVIDWFDNMANKSECIFVPFDIKEFYLSISKDLVLKATDRA